MIDDLAAVAKCGPESIILNAVINGKINMKRLEFNQKKCVKLHICKQSRQLCPQAEADQSGARNVRCVFIEAQECEMKTSDAEKYIGDVISSSGSNDANISRRISLGLGAISQIFGILSEITLGYQFIQIGLIMRESILLNKILLSSESWHRLFKYQIEKLEDVDSAFYRKLYNGHAKTSLECYISESGTVPIRFLISSRRLMYWWHIEHADQSERIQKVYKAQKLSPISGDWIELLE